MVFTCVTCERNFETPKGLNIHLAYCRKKHVAIKTFNKVLLSSEDNNNNIETTTKDSSSDIQTSTILDAVELLIERENIITPNLPTYKESSTPAMRVNTLSANEFETFVNSAYDETIFWKKNLFFLPSGKNAKLFINELSYWLDQFNRDTNLHRIALKVFMILPNLLLQKPSKQSKAKEHNVKLGERLQLWKDGDIKSLVNEGRTIQKRIINTNKKRSEPDVTRIFSKLMMEGKVSAAIKFLSENNDHGVLPASEETVNELMLKHPSPALIHADTLLEGPLNIPGKSYFDNINGDLIKQAARQTKGAPGPSKLDADQFKNMLISNKFKHEGFRRIIGKAIGWVLKDEIQEVAGPLQVATGLESGAEAAIHAMRNIFENEDCEAVILVDASNAFNSLNRQVALHNIQYICPQFATILINTYRNPARLIISAGKEILSQEGTTQGDNLAMSFYALSTVLMQHKLRSIPTVKQVWFADDATGAGKIDNIKQWWDLLIFEGRKYGYYVNESKSWIIVKHKMLEEQAKTVFANLSVKCTTTGKRHLGASIGSNEFRKEYATEKINEWCDEMKKLSEIALLEPQAAFAAFTHGELHKFSYFLRTIPGMEEYLQPLDSIITDLFIPSLLGATISENERQIFQQTIKDGGLGIPVLVEKAKTDFESSTIITAPLAAIIISQGHTIPSKSEVKQIRNERAHQVNVMKKDQQELLETKLDTQSKRVLAENREKGASSWLNVLPLKEQGFTLTKEEFQDALALRYDRDIKHLPSKCVCGDAFDATHAMNCKKGGFVSIRHDNVRNFEANLLKKVCNDVEIEPALQPVDNDEARLDIRARGFWRPGQSAYFDVRLTNTNSNSQLHIDNDKIYKKHENEKKRKYNDRVMNKEHGSFTPLVFSINGGMSPECTIYHKFLAEKISQKTEQRYDQVMAWIRCKLSFLIIRSALLCLRGSRSVRKMNTDCIDDFGLACDEARL